MRTTRTRYAVLCIPIHAELAHSLVISKGDTQMANTLQITGYLQGGECKHCGRELRHCIVTTSGIFGARCFGNAITKPRTYNGKPYRLSTDAVISLAKMARDPARHGIGSYQLTFEWADAFTAAFAA